MNMEKYLPEIQIIDSFKPVISVQQIVKIEKSLPGVVISVKKKGKIKLLIFYEKIIIIF